MKFLVLFVAIGLAAAQTEGETTTGSPQPTTESVGTTTGGQSVRCNGHQLIAEEGCYDKCHHIEEAEKSKSHTTYTEFVEGRACELREGWWILAKRYPGVCKMTTIRAEQQEVTVPGCVVHQDK